MFILQENGVLITLNLSYNEIKCCCGQSDGRCLINYFLCLLLCQVFTNLRILQENVVLTTLNLAYNGLSVAGAKAMADALEMNDVLTDLNLTCNRIFDEGAVTIGKALLINETLKKLRVRTNNSILYSCA